MEENANKLFFKKLLTFEIRLSTFVVYPFNYSVMCTPSILIKIFPPR